MTSAKKRKDAQGAQSKNLVNSTIAGAILSTISRGTKEAPIRRQDLAIYAPDNAKDKDRAVRDIIHELREKGTPICANYDTGGYYLARNRDEWEEFQVKYISGALRIMKAAKAVERTWDEIDAKALYGKMLEEYGADPLQL